ncbi:MAG: CDK5RAP3 family protein [Candidatus Thiodiazotropha sp. (ex Lucinoma kastoroae)]|nr:CDK5RAP3 family protein [Candidatus Thiodiazotropha sp. (ex Rostrolucina anterorostrata)]MCU7846865.1 CDK5RAP3 family protein [Candidatus Thiodiazotropha sp. (ex Lucinoma kastoroae)]MCU7858824.1 CDK5RAP3 family protein [Candidatus Thiodiazotropha sp. (ex Lucinoma kastoroae)]
MPPPEKIVKKLLNLLDAGKKKDRAKCDRISDLLKQLKKQERIAKDKLANEKDNVKRKRLSTDVKIIHTQRKKAIKRFKELKKKC